MTTARREGRLARLERALRVGEKEAEPILSWAEGRAEMEIVTDHLENWRAGHCGYGDGLTPRQLRTLQGWDHMYDLHIQPGTMFAAQRTNGG